MSFLSSHRHARAMEALPAGARAPIEEIQMQSTHRGKQLLRMHQSASTTVRRGSIRATPRAAMTGWTGSVILVTLFLASAAYVVFGGAYEVASSPEAAISIVAVALEPANGGRASRTQSASGSSAEPTDYFPADYVARGREGDGNVETYEHN